MKLYKIFYAFCIIALVAAFAGCSKDDPIIDQLNAHQVYFPNTLSKTIELSTSVNQVEIPVMRMGSDAVTIPLKVTYGETNVADIKAPESISFAAGEKKTSIVINYDPSKVEPGHYDQVTIAFSDDYNTPYGYSSAELNLGQAEPWVSLGKGTIKDNWVWGEADDKAEVEILQNQLYPNRFRVVDPFNEIATNRESKPKDGFTHYLDITIYKKGDVYRGVTLTEDDMIVYTVCNTGLYMDSYGSDIYMYHPSEFSNFRKDDSNWVNNKVNFYQENGLPAQFSFAPIFYMPDHGGYWNGTDAPDQIVITMPGVVIADYSCEVTYSGKFEDVEGGVYGEASVKLGEDVAKAKATIVAGRNNEEEGVAGILDGSLKNVTDLKKSGDVRVAMPENAETGYYTFVVVTFDANGDAKKCSSTTFKYTASGEIPETYSLVGQGTFVYKYVFCNDDGSPYYDEGLDFYVCDQKPYRYKVTSVFYGVEFVFDVDEEGIITFEDQFTGAETSSGDLMVCDIHGLYPDNFPTPSHQEGDVFFFNCGYYADNGWWRYDQSDNNDDLEYFKLSAEGAPKAKAGKKAKVKGVKKVHNSLKFRHLPPHKGIIK